MSTDSEHWVALGERLSAVSLVARPKPVGMGSGGRAEAPEGFKALDVKRVARFVVDVSDGDRKKATDLARRFSRRTADRIFARAVVVAVERYLARAEKE